MWLVHLVACFTDVRAAALLYTPVTKTQSTPSELFNSGVESILSCKEGFQEKKFASMAMTRRNFILIFANGKKLHEVGWHFLYQLDNLNVKLWNPIPMIIRPEEGLILHCKCVNSYVGWSSNRPESWDSKSQLAFFSYGNNQFKGRTIDLFLCIRYKKKSNRPESWDPRKEGYVLKGVLEPVILHIGLDCHPGFLFQCWTSSRLTRATTDCKSFEFWISHFLSIRYIQPFEA